MSTFIEDFYYGNIEPQEVNSELTPKLKKKLSNLAEKEGNQLEWVQRMGNIQQRASEIVYSELIYT